MLTTTRYTSAAAIGRGMPTRRSKRTGLSVTTDTIQATSSITTKMPAWLNTSHRNCSSHAAATAMPR